MRATLWLTMLLFSLDGITATYLTETGHKTTFVIYQLPGSTPHDASIYLAASSHGWYPDIEKLKFHKTDSGSFVCTLHHTQDTLLYKITRGSWKAVEGRRNGRARPNRVLTANSPNELVKLEIEAWEDISYPLYFIHMIFLLIGGLQGLLLIIAIASIGNTNKAANQILIVLLFLITIALFGRASTYDPDIFNWQPRLIFIPEILLFSYAPLFYLYMHRLLFLKIPRRNLYWHFTPAIIHFLILTPFLLLNGQTLIYRVIDHDLFEVFAITGVVALIYNTAYWWLCKRLLVYLQRQETLTVNQEKYLRFLNGVLSVKALYLLVWFIAVLIYAWGELRGNSLLWVSENIVDALWILFSFIIFAMAFYAIKHPEVLRQKKKYQGLKSDDGEAQDMLKRLEELLDGQEAYRDPNLTLEQLAHKIPTNTHTLSRIINQQFGQSFNDLINTYRVNSFIKAAQASNDSYLNLALQAGFNSKPTFNRVFKKIKGKTPRNYLKTLPQK